ncbi:MAG: CHAT domain-containing protein [Acidobacteria bacterium]|nr:CHAT domain-containing protein [Acidobacteriota bacterium]
MTGRHGFLLGLAGILLACGARSRATAPAPPAPEVEYSGCWAVYVPGPVCPLRPDRKLRLWVKAVPDFKVEIRFGSRIVDARGQGIAEGRRFLLRFPQRAAPLTVRLCQPEGACGPAWSLSVARPEVPQWFDEVKELQSKGQTDAARLRLEKLLSTASPRQKGLILRQLALIAGQDAKAVAYFEQGMAADRAEHCVSCEVDKATLLAKRYLDQGLFSDARQLLALKLPVEAPGGAKCLVAYNQGLLAGQVGDYRSALEQLQKAANLAERIGNSDYQWDAEQVLARLYQDLGRSQYAEKLFARLLKSLPEKKPCDQGVLLANEAWARLLRHEAGESASDPTPELTTAQAIFENQKNGCQPERLNGLLNLALAHLQAGREREFRNALEQARPLLSQATLRQRLWALDLEAREAITKGEPKRALRLYDELAGIAESSLSLEGRFRAAFGRARARLKLGQRREALAALAKADRLIDEQSRHAPVDEGRDTVVAQREGATRLYLELLLESRQWRRAFALTRQARSRLLRQLAIRDRRLTPEEQKEWDDALSRYWERRRQEAEDAKLPKDERQRARKSRAQELAEARKDLDRAITRVKGLESLWESSLSPPGRDEVILAYHPLPEGWVGFAAAHGRPIEVSRFEMPSPLPGNEALSALILAPFRKAIARAGRIRVLPYGVLRSVDFHALPLDGELLLARHPVIYGLDLPRPPKSPPSSRSAALLVSNPQSDLGYLPAAQEEAQAVSAAIGNWGRGWTLKQLDGPAASSAALTQALPQADLFHYAGHGNYDASFAGWDSALPLANGSRLIPGDILMLRRVPRWVVLSACDTSRSSEEAPAEGIGLANAFLLAGSRAVIAATRQVDDKVARDLLLDLYRGWRPGEETDLALQLQRAELTCRHRDPKADCMSFRLLEP